MNNFEFLFVNYMWSSYFVQLFQRSLVYDESSFFLIYFSV